ncbi:hypothetical protein M8J76_004237 [Diaphorina citri]|nr:hypothetical protein M8J75_006634 [Diaphorina citri]KAI5744665.1 hypothetical protein M8J76_004237 [Diaphorina citri]
MVEYTPKGVQAMTEKMKKQNFDKLKWYENNNEFLRAKTMNMKDTTSAMLKHMRQSQQDKCAQTKRMMRSADPFHRFVKLASPFDVMYPVAPSDKYKNNSMGPSYHYDDSRSTYLKNRLSLDPSQKYVLPQTTSMRYGWLLKEKSALLDSGMTTKSVYFGRKHHF